MRGQEGAAARTLTVQFRQAPAHSDLVSSPDTSFSLRQTEPSKHLWRAVLVLVRPTPCLQLLLTRVSDWMEDFKTGLETVWKLQQLDRDGVLLDVVSDPGQTHRKAKKWALDLCRVV